MMPLARPTPLLLDESGSLVYEAPLGEAHFRQASFLDERVLASVPPGRWRGWEEIERMSAGAQERLDFIFHIGHVGSTLLSRLLGQCNTVLSLREPAILRPMAELHFNLPDAQSRWSMRIFETRLGALLGLWAVTFRPGQRTLLKATSFVSEMADHLLGRQPGSKAILMTVRPETYLATILAGAGSRVELGVLAPARLRRLHRRVGMQAWQISELSEGEIAAMSWACEASSLAEAARARGSQAMWLDFDAFLADPRSALRSALIHLHGTAAELDLAAMLVSADFRRYSKAPEHAYDAALRRDILDQARNDHRAEIEKGLAWLSAAASRFAGIEEAVARAGVNPPKFESRQFAQSKSGKKT